MFLVFLEKYGDLYNLWFDLLLKNINLDDFKLQQIKFLEDLMNRSEVYRNITKPENESDYKARDLYLKLFGNPNNTVNDILFLRNPADEYNKEIYLQAKKLFDLMEEIFKELSKKGIIKSNSDQSGIDDYEESIAERTKLRRQKSNEQLDTANMSELESEESSGEGINPQEKGFKILTPN